MLGVSVKVTFGMPGPVQRMEGNAKLCLAIARERVDPLKLRIIARLARTQDDVGGSCSVL